jgi:hypothetical protein
VATVRRSAPGVLLAAALAVVTVACGSSHTPPPRAVMLDAKAVVDASDSEYAYVTDTAQPRLLQVVDSSSDGGELSFGYPGTPVAITPPARQRDR